MNTTQDTKEEGRTEGSFLAAYERLNVAQKEAVDTIEGPVMVVAGPGTGKTQILTLRIANILRLSGAGIDPQNILALTFTNAGVVAMRTRLASFIGVQDAYNVGIYTFHSFAEEQMRHYPEYFPEFAYARTISDIDRFRALEDILKNNDLEMLKTFASESHYVRDIAYAIDELKNEGIDPKAFLERLDTQEKNVLADDASYYKRDTKKYKKGDLKPDALKHVRKNRELQIVYAQYQEYLRAEKLYEFSDMILALVAATNAHDVFHAALLEQYQYILVDEHQDTNDGQNAVLSLLTESPVGDAPNLFTVGDDKQAIYRFQGASVENFLHFEKKFHDIKKIHLTSNYRSSQQILDISHRLISSEDSHRVHAELQAEGDAEVLSVDIHVYNSYREELGGIARDIAQKIGRGCDPQEIAVMYRKNKHLTDIVAALEKECVPYIITARENLLEDVQMRKLLLLLQATAAPMNSEAISQALLIDFVPTHTQDVARVLDVVHHQKKQRLLTYIIGDEAFVSEVKGLHNPKAFTEMAGFFALQKEKGENMSFLEFFEQFVQESGFLTHIMSVPTHSTHLRQLDALMQEIRTQMEVRPHFRLADFLRYIETLTTYGVTIETAADRSEKGVYLMSAHKSKGLEFEHVYVTNAITGIWDHARKMQKFKLPIQKTEDSIEDERRLFYVALTRAKSDITITYALMSDSGRISTPTVFVDELSGEHVMHHDHTQEERHTEDIFRARSVQAVSVLDPVYIREKFLSTPLSVSALNNYLKSPLLYFFRNLIRLPQAQTKSLMFGNVIHGAFELYFKDVAQEKKVLPPEVLVSYFDTVLEQTYLLAEYREDLEKRGHELLTGYWNQYQDAFEVDILSEEKIKAVPFMLEDGTEITLTGVIDKLEVLPGGGIRVVDYKTGKPWSKKTKEDRAGLERQIVFYKILLDTYEKDGAKKYDMQEGVLDFVEPATKQGTYEREVFHVSAAQIDTLREEINDCARAIISGSFLEEKFPRTRDTEKYVDLWEALNK